MTNTVTAPRRARLAAAADEVASAAALGFAGLGTCAVLFMALHVATPAGINPLAAPMSDYALADGIGWMFGVGVLAIAAGGLGAMLALARAGMLGAGLLRVAMALIVVSAVLTAVFPTDESFPLSLTAEIHRYAAVTLFTTVPVAAAIAAARFGRPVWLGATASVAAALLVVFLLSHLPAMPHGMQDLRGLFQRVLTAVELAILAQLCAAPHRASPGFAPRESRVRTARGRARRALS